jgi:hypothetical protein
MMEAMKLWLLPFIIVNGAAQTSDVPYAPGSDGPGPTYMIEQVHNCYPGSFSSIQAINFRDFHFLSFGKDGRPLDGYTLKNGHFQHDAKFDHYSTEFESIHYFPSADPSTANSAVVVFSWFAAAGSTSQGGNAKVFNLSGKRLCVVQEVGWDTHFQSGQPTDSFDPSTNTLVIRSAHYIPGDAHCCVSALDVVTLRWDGTKFRLATVQTELTEYAKAEGKELPKANLRQ